MRKFFAIAMGTAVALAGFAGTASASSTVDLIWIDAVSGGSDSGGPLCLESRDCPLLGTTTSNVATSDNITLLVVITGGPAGSSGGGVSVNYSELAPNFSVIGFQSLESAPYLRDTGLGSTTNQPPYIDSINAAASGSLGLGLGLSPGQSAYFGTVSFHEDSLENGTFQIDVGLDGPGGTDFLADGSEQDEGGTVVFNPAFVVNVPEPGALSLLVMGLGGMLLAGRGRK